MIWEPLSIAARQIRLGECVYETTESIRCEQFPLGACTCASADTLMACTHHNRVRMQFGANSATVWTGCRCLPTELMSSWRYALTLEIGAGKYTQPDGAQQHWLGWKIHIMKRIWLKPVNWYFFVWIARQWASKAKLDKQTWCSYLKVNFQSRTYV